MTEDQELPEPRYVGVLVSVGEETRLMSACLECGLLVGIEPLHQNRCYGQKVTDDAVADGQVDLERRIEEGEFDEEEEPLEQEILEEEEDRFWWGPH